MSQKNPLKKPKTNQDFFTNLPSEIIIDIFSRLPILTIISCKCVCKSWLELVESHEFAKSHLSKSVPGLVVLNAELNSRLYNIFEFEDALDLEHHELHCNLVTKFSLPLHGWILGSANGLLFLRNVKPNCFTICNPITRDFVQLHCPQEFVCTYPQVVTYGFGASKITGQHKVVSIFQDCTLDRETHKVGFTKSECQVYTLGTGSWRSIAPSAPFDYSSYSFGSYLFGAFFYGNLHWLVCNLNGSLWISCFDLETEVFSTFSTPLLMRRGRYEMGVFALGDCLCLSDNRSDDEIVIWLMKEYGVEKSWTKEFVISKFPDFPDFPGFPCGRGVVYPIKVFKDGDILMAWENSCLFYYSTKNETTHIIDMFDMDDEGCINAILHTSSLLSLKSFVMEDVSSF